MALELLLYQAFLQGSAPIVDIDPKGDHRLERLPGVAEAMETIELGPDGALPRPARPDADRRRGRARGPHLHVPDRDPARGRCPPSGRPRSAPRSRSRRRPSARTHRRGPRRAARARRRRRPTLPGRSRSTSRPDWRGSATRSPAASSPEVGSAQVISLRIRNLTRPLPGTARSELQEDERVSQAVLRLLAAYALRLCAADERSALGPRARRGLGAAQPTRRAER